MRTLLLLASLLVGVTAVAPVSQEDVEEMDCEMCGLLVHNLEQLKALKAEELADHKGSLEEKSAKLTPARRRANRAEVPAEIFGHFEEYLEKTACETVTRNQLCGPNGDDGSKLRNPSNVPFDFQSCKDRLKERCEALAQPYAEVRSAPTLAQLLSSSPHVSSPPRLTSPLLTSSQELMDAAWNNLTATACGEIMPAGCTDKQATKLLGPFYGKEGEAGRKPWGMHGGDVGVKDVWKKSAHAISLASPVDLPCISRVSPLYLPEYVLKKIARRRLFLPSPLYYSPLSSPLYDSPLSSPLYYSPRPRPLCARQCPACRPTTSTWRATSPSSSRQRGGTQTARASSRCRRRTSRRPRTSCSLCHVAACRAEGRASQEAET